MNEFYKKETLAKKIKKFFIKITKKNSNNPCDVRM